MELELGSFGFVQKPELMTFAWEFWLCAKLRTSDPMLELMFFTVQSRVAMVCLEINSVKNS
jgi:hypothetical protein